MNTSAAVSIDPAVEAQRSATLLRQAPLEFARVVYGLSDRASGRGESMAAKEVAHAERHGVPLTRERAEQRARSYLPVPGHGHCPRCWVFGGLKNPLQYRPAEAEQPEVAVCGACDAEYCIAPD